MGKGHRRLWDNVKDAQNYDHEDVIRSVRTTR